MSLNNKYRLLRSLLSNHYRVQVKYWYWPFRWYDVNYDLFEDKNTANDFIEWHKEYLKQ